MQAVSLERQIDVLQQNRSMPPALRRDLIGDLRRARADVLERLHDRIADSPIKRTDTTRFLLLNNAGPEGASGPSLC